MHIHTYGATAEEYLDASEARESPPDIKTDSAPRSGKPRSGEPLGDRSRNAHDTVAAPPASPSG